jgi:hypothetical protein
MHLALYVPIRIYAMVYILVKMCLALAMAYAPFEMHMALVMVYVPIKTCLNPYVLIEVMVMAYILVKMHLAHNNIFNVSFETQTKIHYVI